ncbi:MAG TPA: peptide ABC transporter substrate-binding protein [Bdellovibrionota bacterium]|jgi:oligopeptide transport system substrate-binding protein
MKTCIVLWLLLFTAAASAEPKVFRARLIEDLGTLDWNYGEVNTEIVYQMMEGLFRSDHQGRPKPAAAKSFQWNGDKSELSITLRKDRAWSDGQPLCAQQFVDSWTRLGDKKFASPFAHYATVLKEFKAKGCHELKVTFQRPAPEAPALFANFVFLPIRLDVLEKSPKAFTEGVSLAVNGPFKVSEWKRNALLVLERNPNYRGAKPALDKIEFRFIAEDSTAKTLFERGEVDWVKDVPRLMRSPELEQSAEFHIFPSLIVYYFGLNAGKTELLKDPKVREALSAALDRSEIQKVLGKECVGTEVWLLPQLQAGLKAVAKELSPKVREQLQALQAKGKLDLVLRTYNKTPHKMLAEWAQGQWEKKLGVRIPIEVQESKVYWKEIQVQAAPIFFGGVTAPFGHQRALMQEFLTTSSANWTGWSSAAYDKAVEKEKFSEAEKILERDGFIIPIYRRDQVALVQKKWKGFFVNPLAQVYLDEVR